MEYARPPKAARCCARHACASRSSLSADATGEELWLGLGLGLGLELTLTLTLTLTGEELAFRPTPDARSPMPDAPAVRSRRSVVSGAPLSRRTTCAWVGASSVGTVSPGNTPGKYSSNSRDRSSRYSSWLAVLPMGAQMTHAAP